MPKQAQEIETDNDALIQVCGSEGMMEKVRALWTEMMEKKPSVFEVTRVSILLRLNKKQEEFQAKE